MCFSVLLFLKQSFLVHLFKSVASVGLYLNEGNSFVQGCTDLHALSPISCRRTKAYCKTTMDLRWFRRLILLACILRTSPGCPSACRCYSLTVECGSLGLKEIPQGLLSATEVSWPIDTEWAHIAARALCFPHQQFCVSIPPTLNHSY